MERDPLETPGPAEPGQPAASWLACALPFLVGVVLVLVLLVLFYYLLIVW